jgi:predicted RNA binding protein YcfA (HicA-like mRNA interferase family)
VKFGRREPGGYIAVIVPKHREVAAGTLRSILRQAQVTWEEFDAL